MVLDPSKDLFWTSDGTGMADGGWWMVDGVLSMQLISRGGKWNTQQRGPGASSYKFDIKIDLCSNIEAKLNPI